MKRILVIGIGPGGAEHLTVQAIEALNRADVIFTFDKGEAKSDLLQLRRDICERYRGGKPYRLIEIANPERGAAGAYKADVRAWHRERAEIVKGLIRDELADTGCGAFLVWGDPAFYDSTLRILEAVAGDPAVTFEYEVIPGISSVQLLAARHKIPLNSIGEPILLTTGRKLAEAYPAHCDSIVVLLDGGAGLDSLAGKDVDIFWGAYLGTPDEILIAGCVADVLDDIRRIREERRAAKGWIMDTYLLRSRSGGS
jgi:precorrin-6A synthase